MSGLGNPGSIFCCILSKQNNNPFHNLYGCKFLKITFKISSQFCLPTFSHNNIEFDGCKINLEIQLHQTYANIPSGFVSSFENIEDKHDVYGGKGLMKIVSWIFQRPRIEDNQI